MMTSDLSRAASARAVRAGLIAIVLLAVACESAESKRMKAMAGDYISDYESEIPPGHVTPWITSRSTLTLRPDGRWKFNRVTVINDDSTVENPDSGSYRVDGTTLATSASEQSRGGRYTISGDTLWSLDNGQRAMAEAVTGVKVAPPEEQTFFVRQR